MTKPKKLEKHRSREAAKSKNRAMKPDILYPGPQAEFANYKPKAQSKPTYEPEPIMPQSHLEYVAVIRAIAVVIVIAGTIIFPQTNGFSTNLSVNEQITSTIYLIGKTGLPLLTMISGLLLLNPQKINQPAELFFWKRFFKALIPFAAWSGIYIAYRLYWLGEQLPADIMESLLTRGSAYEHLWFLQIILALYLVTPILQTKVKAASRQNLTYCLIIWYVATSLTPYFDRFVASEIGAWLATAIGYAGFFILGIYLRNIKLKGRHFRWAIYAIGLIWAVSGLISRYGIIENNGQYGSVYSLSIGYSVIPLSALFFLIFKSLNWMAVYRAMPRFKWAIKKISAASLGIYCVHQIIIHAFYNGTSSFVFDEAFANTFINVPIVTLAVIFISAVIILEMQKVPILNKIVP